MIPGKGEDMPNRWLKESIKASREIEQLSFFQECMFYRLIVSADDFGRYYGDPVLLKSYLFPRKENVSTEEIETALITMAQVGLIYLYVDEKGERFLQFVSWAKHQQIRSNKSKFPNPVALYADPNNPLLVDSNDTSVVNNCLQTVNKCPRKRERITNTNTENDNEDENVSDVDAVGEDLLQIQNDHNEILDAAQAAGFPGNQATFDKIIGLYADYGKEIVLQGISACVDQGKTTIAYLKGCCHHAMEGTGKPAAGGKRNPFVDMLEGVAANG